MKNTTNTKHKGTKGRVSVYTMPVVLERLKKQANKHGLSLSEEIERIITSRNGITDDENLIAEMGTSFIWINKFGTFGDLTPEIYKRFCKDGTLPLLGDRWDDVVDGIYELLKMYDAVPICKMVYDQLYIYDADKFVDLHTKYRITAKSSGK